MKPQIEDFLAEHRALTRRYFLALGAAGMTAAGHVSLLADTPAGDKRLKDAIEQLESFLTLPDDFRDVSRGKPIPHQLPQDQKSQVGLTRESWKLSVVSDPQNPARLRSPMTDETALDFAGLMELAREHAVRFPKVMTCLNIGCPLGMGIWEGVPLREVIWRTQPRDKLRRVFYYGFHNNDPKQMFRSSLAVGRVLEDPFDLPPVILCYKLNGQWLTSERGGPVRVVVPEAYGFKSIKWLSHVFLSNLAHANDTYAGAGNDVDSPLKTFAATLSVPAKVHAGESIPITGYAQVGISGLTKVQAWLESEDSARPAGDRWFASAPWQDAQILGPPSQWGGGLPTGRIPDETMYFETKSGRPTRWPLRLGKAHWAVLLPGMPAGQYVLRSRTIDDKGHAQPLPRPFRKSGHAAIEEVPVTVSS